MTRGLFATITGGPLCLTHHTWRLYRQHLSVPSVHFGCPLCTVILIRLKVVSVWCHCLADAVLRHDGLEFSGTRVDVSPSLGLNAGELFVACLHICFPDLLLVSTQSSSSVKLTACHVFSTSVVTSFSLPSHLSLLLYFQVLSSFLLYLYLVCLRCHFLYLVYLLYLLLHYVATHSPRHNHLLWGAGLALHSPNQSASSKSRSGCRGRHYSHIHFNEPPPNGDQVPWPCRANMCYIITFTPADTVPSSARFGDVKKKPEFFRALTVKFYAGLPIPSL